MVGAMRELNALGRVRPGVASRLRATSSPSSATSVLREASPAGSTIHFGDGSSKLMSLSCSL